MVVIMVALMVNASPAAAIEPHEDPDTALWVFDGVSLLNKYSEALDNVLGRNATGVSTLREQASRANIPAELGDAVDHFLSSSHSLAGLIPEIESDLEMSRKMLGQFRTDEAEASAAAAEEKLTQAYDQLEVMEREAKATGHWWQADSAKQGSALRDAYQGVLDRLVQLRRLLDLLGQMRGSLAEQTGALAAVAKGDLEKLEELITEGVLPPGLLAMPDKSALFRPTALSLWVEPLSVFVGDTVEFGGELSSEGQPLPGRKVTILLGGAPVSEEITDSKGIYRGHITLPYQYVPEITLQAIYYPQGDDIGLYLGSSSPEVTMRVLYYVTGLNLEVPENAYPGLRLMLKGQFNYGDNPAAQVRSLQVYWDGRLAAEKTVTTTTFTLELEVAHEARLGRHRLGVYVSPDKRYGPASAGADVEVVKLTPVIEVDAPAVVLLPLAHDIKGRVYSSLGPLQQAFLRISLGNWETTTRTGNEGTFHARLSTGLSFTLVGSQALQVSVTPTEPWHKPSSSTTELLIINLANIVGLILVLAISFLLGIRQWRRRPAPIAVPAAPQPSPALVVRQSHPSQPMLLKVEAHGGLRATLIALYRGVLRLVQGLTAVILGPSYTLREYVLECAPKLGILAGYFQDFTMIVERLLYSQYTPSEKDIKYSRQLADKIEEAAKKPKVTTTESLLAHQIPGEDKDEARAFELTGRVPSVNPWRQSTTWLWVLLIVAVAYFACILLFLLPLVVASLGS
jgi:hypothetical protein